MSSFLRVFLFIIGRSYNNTHVVMFGLINLKGKQTQTPLHLFAVEMNSKSSLFISRNLKKKIIIDFFIIFR